MKINAWKFGVAGSMTVTIIYTIFAIALKLWTAQTLKFVGTVHMMPRLDYISSFIRVTPGAIFMGLITHVVIGFLIFWLIASIYNALQNK